MLYPPTLALTAYLRGTFHPGTGIVHSVANLYSLYNVCLHSRLMLSAMSCSSLLAKQIFLIPALSATLSQAIIQCVVIVTSRGMMCNIKFVRV